MAMPDSADILQAVIEATPDAIFVKDLEGRYVVVNEAFARFIGKSRADIVGRNDFELYPEVDARTFVEADRRVIATGSTRRSKASRPGRMASRRPTSSRRARITTRTAAPWASTAFPRHHRAARTENLKRTGSAVPIAEDGSGRAADWRSGARLQQHPRDHPRQHRAAQATAAGPVPARLSTRCCARRCMAGIDWPPARLLRRRLLNPQAVDVNVVVAGIVRLLGRTLGATIRVTTSTSTDAGMAYADPAALEAAVLNVALNARDAMPEGGSLAIHTSTVRIAGPPAPGEDLEPGLYVRIAFEDNGSGMPPDVLARVFEPFFTTKSGGRGTGLGLSMVYGFAKQSGGTVQIVSEVGRGTTVSLYLPLAGSDLQTTATNAAPVVVSSVPRTILVVEDEVDVRTIVRRQLESLGHRVLVADAATEALLLIQVGAPDVLLTDVVLKTGVNGIDLAQLAREARPGLPVIFLCGYTAVPEAQQRIRDTGAPLLSKPFTTPQLERAVNAVCAALR
jgi:CheY-like chemotaxis protein